MVVLTDYTLQDFLEKLKETDLIMCPENIQLCQILQKDNDKTYHRYWSSLQVSVGYL